MTKSTPTTFSMPGTTGSAALIFKSEYHREKIGIIGLGFVGTAIRAAMDFDFGINKLVLLDPKLGHHATYTELRECSGIFVCVPSPQNENGSCDTSILEDVLSNLKGYTGVIISKVTAPPDVYERLHDQYPTLVHVPEFLTAAKANRDYVQGEFTFIGGSVPAYQREAERIIKLGQHDLKHTHFCTIGAAALAKYTINSFMATKVIFMNELYKLATTVGIDYDKVVSMISSDTRIGNSHLQVPGPDGNLGFGGACFPKDTEALLKYAGDQGVPMNVLDAAVKKNTLLRLTEPK